MKKEFGFYNRFIYDNNSYLSLHVIRETYRNNKKRKNVNKIIDNELESVKTNQNVKNSLKNIKLKASIKRLNLHKKNDKSVNTFIETFDKSTNTYPLEINIENANYLSKLTKSEIIASNKYNSNNATLSNRINLLKKK